MDCDRVRIGVDLEGGTFLWFHCPGCGENHGVPVNRRDGSRPNWSWNGCRESPTLSPSLLVRFSRLTEEGWRQYREWQAGGAFLEQFDSENVVCHSFVRDGRIEFLADCTHALAGQTISLEPVGRDTIDAAE